MVLASGSFITETPKLGLPLVRDMLVALVDPNSISATSASVVTLFSVIEAPAGLTGCPRGGEAITRLASSSKEHSINGMYLRQDR